MVRTLAHSIVAASLMSGVLFAKAKEGDNGTNIAGDGSIVVTPEQAEFMRELGAAQAGGGFLYVGQELGQGLATSGFIAVNPEVKDENGQFGAKLTDSGLAWVASNAPTGNENKTETKTAATPRAKIEVERGAPMGVKGKRGGGRTGGSIYPFDGLAAPVANPAATDTNGYDFDSFHVAPKAAANGKEAQTVQQLLKSLSSTVSQQNSAKAIEIIGEDGKPVMETVKVRGKEVTRPATRNDVWFVALQAHETDKKGAGVRVFRIDDKFPELRNAK